MPDGFFDHVVSGNAWGEGGTAGVGRDEVFACERMKEYARLVRPGGFITLYLINNPDAPRSLRPPPIWGGWHLHPDLWYRLAAFFGAGSRAWPVTIRENARIFSYATHPDLASYDLHSLVRYTVHMQRPADATSLESVLRVDCNNPFAPRPLAPRFTTDGKPCPLPFTFLGVPVHDCLGSGSSGGGFCPASRNATRATSWLECEPVVPILDAV